MSYLPCVEINPEQTANRSVIWLHGLGADGNDFAPIVPHLQAPAGCHVRFVFPHAPQMPVTINGGMRMPAWYDILSMSIERKVDTEQLRASAAEIRKLIEREQERGVKPEHIILAGFSQGGAVAYETALSHSQRLGGLLALSTYLATYESISLSDANRDLPILIQHGNQDPVVPESLGKLAYNWLADQGYPAEFQSFAMQHQVCGEQIAAINTWLSKHL